MMIEKKSEIYIFPPSTRRSMLASMEFANLGKNIIDSQMGEGENGQTGTSRRPLSSPASKKFLVSILLTLLMLLIVYQTFMQFFVKLIDNENVLKIIQSYLEKNEQELKVAQVKLSNLACQMNGSYVECMYNKLKD